MVAIVASLGSYPFVTIMDKFKLKEWIADLLKAYANIYGLGSLNGKAAI